jgi:protein gp37
MEHSEECRLDGLTPYRKKAHLARGCKERPLRIFVDSMGDLFDPHVDWDWFYQIVQVMMNANQHTFLVFTKFAARMEQFVNSRDIERLVSGRKSDHIIWCATAENQLAADARAGHVCNLKWGRKGISAEPMLGAIDLRAYLDRLDWVVCGGQSGPGARPMHPAWARSLRDQCAAAEVPFFFKQHGEWRAPIEGERFSTANGRAGHPPAFLIELDGTVSCYHRVGEVEALPVVRVGKVAAGSLLDGVEHKAFPEVTR